MADLEKKISFLRGRLDGKLKLEGGTKEGDGSTVNNKENRRGYKRVIGK